MISNIYITSNNYEAALPYLEDHIENNPKDKQTLLNLSGISFRLSKWEKASKYYKSLFSLFPEEEISNHQFLIQSLVNLGKIESAFNELESFISRNPKNNNAKVQQKKLKELFTKKPSQ